jgi:alkylation response protein AidB-like acyl-CoA dehydrogenase
LNLQLTKEQLLFQEEIREFTKEKIIPTADERDRKDIYPLEIIKEMADLGYTSLTVPEQFNGMGRTKVEASILMEEFTYGYAATAISLITIFQAVTMLMLFGNDKLKNHYLPLFREGLIASYSLTECSRGSDIRSVDTKTVKKGTDWVINDKETFFTSGSAVEFFILLAETEKGVHLCS